MTESEIEFFDKLAPIWDANEMRSVPERIRSILGKLPIRKGDAVLDLGTGTGVLVPYLSGMVGENGSVTAVDLSDGMLSRAIEKFGNLPNVSFLKIDFEEEMIPGEYDVIMLYSVYPHLHYPRQTLEWLFKMNMKPGGVAVIAFPCDEEFINSIHHERQSDSDHLPPASVLAERIRGWGFDAKVVASTSNEYIVIVSR